MSVRLLKLASNVRAIIGEVIQNRLSDPRISPLTSVTRVEVSADLSVAKVYVSVMGTEAEIHRTFRGLTNATGHIQRILARELRIRQCPQIRLHLDESLKRAAETIDIIDQTQRAHGDAASEGHATGPGEDDVGGAVE